MSRRPSSRPITRHDREERLAHALLGSLRGAPPAPDQTTAIMHRLGYVSVSDREARRRRARRARSRIAMTLTAFAVLGVSGMAYWNSDLVRKPVGTTVQDALREDLRQNQQRLDRTIETIRSLSPAPPPPEPQVEQVAAGPFRWL